MTATRAAFEVASADFTPGVSLVEASAGTGKTFSLALSVVRLLLLRDAAARPVVRDVGRLLVVTYTNAATDELVTRIRKVLRVAHDLYAGIDPAPEAAEVPVLRTLTHDHAWATQRMRDALAALDTLSVHTIHGFCKRVLDEFALESGTPFATTLLQDEAALVEDALRDWWRRRLYDNPALAQYAVASGLQPQALASLWPLRHNWPDARLEPGLDLDGFDRALLDGVRAVAATWNRDDFEQRVQGLSWNKSATLTTPESREDFSELLQWAAQLPVGHADLLHTVAPAIAALSTELLSAAIAKRGDRAKAVVAELPSWPIVQRADAVAALLADLGAVLRADAQRAAEEAVEQAKRATQQVGFSDLLRRLHRVLEAQGPTGPLATALRAHFDAALIDEFQDTDRQQFAIFTTVFRDRPLVLIGDPKQSIYGFRGADVRAYLDATHLAPPDRQYALRKNFRSTGPMIGAVQQLFHRRRARPFLVDGVEYDEISAGKHHEGPKGSTQSPALHFMSLTADDDGAFLGVEAARTQALDATAQRIFALLAQGWTAGRIAVLVRTRHEGLRMEAQLREIGVPAVVSGLSSIFATNEAAELDTVLQAIATPRDSALVRAALATELWGATHAEIAALARGDVPSDATDGVLASDWDAIVDTFVALGERWQREGLIAALHALFDRTLAMPRLLALADGDRRVTNLRHLVELLHRASSTQHLQVEGTLRWLAAERRAAIDGTHDGSLDTEESELRLETDADAVQILTVHKSKGLEYDIVFCPTLWQGRLPTVPLVVTENGAQGDAVLVHGEPIAAARFAHANFQRLAEELRLLYVALTRARFHTWIAWGPVRKGTARDQAALLRADGAAHSALAYLLCDDPTLDDVPAIDVPSHVAAWWVQQGDWQAPVHALVRASGKLIAVEQADESSDVDAWRPATSTAVSRDVRTLPPSPPVSVRFRTFQLSSYTMLARARTGEHADGDRALERDTDDGAQVASDADATPQTAVVDWRTLPPTDFRAFPAGAREGTVLHALFEHTPFADDAASIRARVQDVLRGETFIRDHFDARVASVADMMTRVLDAPFTVRERAVRLRDVPQRQARHEWQFTLPLASPGTPLTADSLADCFLLGDAVSQRYAASLRTLDIRRVHGFLQGFIDLAFAHEGRWYVVDWKSNRLALDPATYDDASLRAVMDAHHYTLQAHLYLVALHRFLRARAAPGYDYDQDVGGAAYAFLRGFGDGASATGHGWALVRPTRAVIDALDALIGTGDPRRDGVRS